MPNNNNTGKAGTMSVEDFESLTSMSSAYGETLLATKVAKICSKRAAPLLREYSGSALGNAYSSVASKITNAVSVSDRTISRDNFSAIGSWIDKYGPELVVQKLAKIAQRNSSADATTLKSIFPR